jgi:hypothetical protein
MHVPVVNFINNASDATVTNMYKKLNLKRSLASQNLWFLRECRRRKVTPKFITISTSHKSKTAESSIQAAKHKWLEMEAKHWYNTRDGVSEKLYYIRAELITKSSVPL